MRLELKLSGIRQIKITKGLLLATLGGKGLNIYIYNLYTIFKLNIQV